MSDILYLARTIFVIVAFVVQFTAGADSAIVFLWLALVMDSIGHIAARRE